VSASVGGGTFTFAGAGVTGNRFNPSGSAGTVVAISVTYTLAGCPNATGTINATVRLATDPLCSGGGTGTCATVVIVPKPSPATCTISNGKIVMSIKPFVPAVNNVGVQIDIKGISATNSTIARTNFNDSTFVNLPVGVYTYTIIYGDVACTKTGQVTIDQSGTVGIPSASNIVSPKCFGQASGAVTISVPGETGNVLQWSLDGGIKDPFKAFTAGSQITGIPAGAAPNFQQVISVRRNSSDPCFAAVTITIPPGAADIIAATTVTNATCSNNDGSILVGTISGGTVPYAFKFDGVGIASLPANNTFAGLASGKHTLTVTDANACSKDFESNITFPGLVDFSVIGTSSSCVATSNGTVTAIISSVGSFKIGISTSQSVKPTTMFDVTSGGSTSYVFDKLPPASYFVFLNSVGSQCQNIKQQDIASAVQDITISYTTGAACTGADGSLVITSVGGGASSYTYSLDGVSFINLPANNRFTGLAEGGHIFRVIDAGGCSKEFAIEVPTPTLVDFTLKNDPLKCVEERATVTLSNFKGASVDYTYQILQQSNVVSSGLISSVNAKQDFVIKDLTLEQGNYQLQLQQNQVSINGCASPIIAVKPFTITGPSRKLDTLYVVKNISLPDLATGSVAVGITESGQDPYEVRVDLSKPLFSRQGYFQDWTKAVRNSENLKLEVQARNLFAGEYLLSVRDGFGCVKDFTFNIKADESIFIPNVITPNGDDFNDTFFIRNLPSSTQVIIVNRWGKEVYKSDDYKNNWDAKDVTEGVYYYRIKAGEEVFTGWVEVLRDNK
jgi:gliding motility-associated-like protein